MDSASQDSSLSESMIKLLIIGGPQVGKSSLVTKFCNNTFTPNYTPTSGVHFKYKMLDFASKNVKVQVWDTAGTDHANPLLKIYYKKAMGILLVFSLCEKQSLEDLEKWVQYLQNNANPNAIIILVGNKSDITEQRIDSKEIKAFQKKYKVDKYVETSVKEGSSANEVFTNLVKEVIERIDKGSFKIEGNSLNGLLSQEKKPVPKIEKSPEKLKKKERDLGIERKEEEENITRKMEGLVETAKKEMSDELEELKKNTQNGLEKLKEELIEKISQQNEEENISDLREELGFLRKAFESFSQSHPEEIFRHITKSDQTITSLVKQNALLEERLSKLEQHTKQQNIEILNTDVKEDEARSSDKTEGSSIPNKKVREPSFDKMSRDPESTRHCSNSTEIFYAAGKKAMESNDRKVIFDSINNPNAFLESERIWEEGSPKKDIGSALPQFYNSEEDDLFRTVEELQYNVAMLTQEVKKLQQTKIHVHTNEYGKRNKKHLRSRGKSIVKENRICQVGDLGESASEIAGLWETINNLVKNTHEEIDKVKEEVKRSKRKIGDRKDALVEKNVNGGIRELRDDIHNQLIEIQRELEDKYGIFRNNLTMNYESFLKYFHTEQNKLRDFMEDRCLEIMEEALRTRERPEGYQIITSRRSLSGEATPISVTGEGVTEMKSQAVETVEEMKKKKALALKIVSIEAQQKQMFSSYTNSFKSVWETLHMLTDKVNSLDDKGSYIAEISRTGGMNDNFIDWRRMEF